MKIFNSIRWRLQIWYGLILLVVLAGYGFTAYQMERGRLLGRVDNELHRRVTALAGPFRQPPRDRRPEGEPSDGPPRGLENRRPRQPFDDGQRENLPQSPREFRLPPQTANLFDESDTNGFYFIIQRNGNTLAKSANAPEQISSLPPPKYKIRNESVNSVVNLPGRRGVPPEPQPSRQRGEFREIVTFTPLGEVILVGRSIAPELSELHFAAFRLMGVGGIVLFLGLAGGWWLASRTIRPIQDISTAAVKISGGDLSQRINTAETESELGKLAAVLNSTFARLETSFTQQQQFTSDAAHELRTPVSVMLTQTQATLNRDRSPAEYRETLESCQRAAQRMRRLIESLLELARLDAGQETLKRMKFDLATTVSDCVELIRPLADERGVKIVSELMPLQCVGDSERLAQVITNLLTNAIQYNKPGGEVRVTLKAQNGVAALTVSDNGAGISAEDLPRVFERFYRADKARSSSAGNAGLGLAISKAIVTAHGGTIEVSSEPGIGTTFTILLPV